MSGCYMVEHLFSPVKTKSNILSVLTDPAAMAHQFAALSHIPEVAYHHAHEFGSRMENLPV